MNQSKERTFTRNGEPLTVNSFPGESRRSNLDTAGNHLIDLTKFNPADVVGLRLNRRK